MEDLVATGPPAVETKHSGISSSTSAGQAGDSRQQSRAPDSSAGQQDDVETTATKHQQPSPVTGTTSTRLRPRRPAQQLCVDESADSDDLGEDAAATQLQQQGLRAAPEAAVSLQPAAAQQQPMTLLDQLLQLQGSAVAPAGAALGQPALLQQLLGQPTPLGGTLGQLQTLQQLLQPSQQPLGVQLPMLLQLLQPAAAHPPSLLQQLLGQPAQASPLQQLAQIQGLLQGVAGLPAALPVAGLGLPAALGLGAAVAAPAPTLAAPAANMQSPVSPSAARGSAQYSSTKKQRQGQPGLPARLAQQEEVEVAVRSGRQARTLSDTSDDDYLPETLQQQKHRQQLGTTVSSPAQPAAAGGDLEAQREGAGATTRIVVKVMPPLLGTSCSQTCAQTVPMSYMNTTFSIKVLNRRYWTGVMQ
jgi:hypothetical protein